MDPSVLAQLQQAYIKNLAAMASGSGGSPDPFTPAVHKTVSQDWLARVGMDGSMPAEPPAEDGRSARRKAARPAADG